MRLSTHCTCCCSLSSPHGETVDERSVCGFAGRARRNRRLEGRSDALPDTRCRGACAERERLCRPSTDRRRREGRTAGPGDLLLLPAPATTSSRRSCGWASPTCANTSPRSWTPYRRRPRRWSDFSPQSRPTYDTRSKYRTTHTASIRNAGQVPLTIRKRQIREEEQYGEVWRRLINDACAGRRTARRPRPDVAQIARAGCTELGRRMVGSPKGLTDIHRG